MKPDKKRFDIKCCWDGFERVVMVIYQMSDGEFDNYKKLNTMDQRSAALDKISKKCS